MTPLAFIALATGPGLFLVHVAWLRDRRREPLWNVLVYFLLGAVAVYPAGVLEALIETPLLRSTPDSASAPRLLLWTFVGVALIEELVKYAVVCVRGRTDRHLDEPYDWIVYAVAVALGFATAENVRYVYLYGAETGWVRAFTAVPAHALDGVLMGTRLAAATFVRGGAALRQRFMSVAEPLLWHAAYDFPLFLIAHETYGANSTVYTLLWIGVFVSQWAVCVSRMRGWRLHQRGHPPPIELQLAPRR